MRDPAYLLNLGATPYLEAWDLQRSLAGAVSQEAIIRTVGALGIEATRIDGLTGVWLKGTPTTPPHALSGATPPRP